MSQKGKKDRKKKEQKKTNVSSNHRAPAGLSGRTRNAKRLKNRKALLMDLVSSKNYQPMRQKEIAMLLQVPSNQRQELAEVLALLVQEGKIDIISEGRYQKSHGAGEVKDRRSLPKEKSSGERRDRRGKRAADKREHSDGEKKPRIQTVDIPAVIEAYQLPTEFPPKVLMQAERCPETLIPNDLDGRMDLRGWQMVTIDGEDARDLDDAVSVTREGMYFQLGVHIADVSNYVQADSALDREALRRGTSVYLPDRVIPMLPKRLSNGICSLNEGEDRLALSCIMMIDSEGRVISHQIAETIICVNRRMTYTDVNAILTEPENHPDLMEKYKELVPMFQRMQELSELLRKNRHLRGAIDFEFPESKVILNEEGTPIDILPYPTNTATRMIEDFMLMANETVAMEYCTREIPFLYRTHDQPDRDRMEGTLQFIREQGVPVEKRSSEITPAEVQKILTQIEGSSKEPLISRLLLRSMSRAVYTPKCSGHFGLAAKYYCHFTSPIRRYPDLQIHRIIKDDLRGRLEKGGRIEKYASILPHVAEQSSAMEQRAAEAERESVKLKKAEYMLEHIGEEYDGVISGVTGWGIYVELPNTVEGLVHIITLRDDFYRYDEENYQLVGEKNGKCYRYGQPVRIRVRSAEPANRTIDFELAAE
ncbi:MAG: ribonuclease R [Fusicatenibacter sp.]|nr:ribonuclease R [Fusicatenibacter sp.]